MAPEMVALVDRLVALAKGVMTITNPVRRIELLRGVITVSADLLVEVSKETKDK